MRRLLRAALLSMGALLLLVGASWLAVVRDTRARIPGIVEEISRFEREGLRPEELPAGWLEILLRVEDPGFYAHGGVDLRTPGAGLTTITQGLAKRYCFESFRPGPLNKARQTFAAIELDDALSKRDQLLLLLNTAGLGPGEERWVSGFPAAAREYFGRDLSELSRREFSTLVAMLVGPATFHPVRGPERLEERLRRIERMLAGECAPSGLRDVYYEGCRDV